VCGWPNASASRRPRPLSPASSLLFCIASGSTVPSSNGARKKHAATSRLPQQRKALRPCGDDGDGDLEVRPRGSSKTPLFTLRRHATERHHAAPSSQSRWTTAKRTTPAEVDRPPAIKQRTTKSRPESQLGGPLQAERAEREGQGREDGQKAIDRWRLILSAPRPPRSLRGVCLTSGHIS
jgi:hypothetical protein